MVFLTLANSVYTLKAVYQLEASRMCKINVLLFIHSLWQSININEQLTVKMAHVVTYIVQNYSTQQSTEQNVVIMFLVRSDNSLRCGMLEERVLQRNRE